MKDANTVSVIYAFLHGYVTHFGVPSIAITDRGVQFQFSMWSQLMTFLACVRKRTTSFHAQCNRLIENFHRMFEECYACSNKPRQLVLQLSTSFAYRAQYL